MEQQTAYLVNVSAQKLVRLALVAYGLQLQGFGAEKEFCELTRLRAVIGTLESGMAVTLSVQQSAALVVSTTGERETVTERPVVEQPSVETKPKDCCAQTVEVSERVATVEKQANYERPRLTLTAAGIEGRVFEVGFGLRTVSVSWNANKSPLDQIRISFPQGPERASANLKGTHDGVVLDLSGAEEVSRQVYGFYNDREAFKGQYLLAEDRLVFQTRWPCYWGKGSVGALDNASQINSFALGLTRALDCPECVEAELGAGEVLYFFFPFGGKAKQFATQNGIIQHSFKGTVDGFRTASLMAGNFPGSRVYGVVRSDQPGIGQLRVCLKEAEWPETVSEPAEPETPAEQVGYFAQWSGPVCQRMDEVFEPLWLGSICVKENS